MAGPAPRPGPPTPELRQHPGASTVPTGPPVVSPPQPRAPVRADGQPEWHHSGPVELDGRRHRPVRAPGGRHASLEVHPGAPRLSVPSAVRGARGAHAKRPARTTAQRPLWRELPLLFVVAGLLALLTRSFVFQAFRIPSGSMENTLRIGDRVLVNKVVYDIRGIQRGDIVVFNGEGSWDPGGPRPSSDPLARGYHDVLREIGIESDGTDYIKRVIGLPGDHVICCNTGGQVTVNGVPLSETSYLYPGSSPSDQRFSVTVPPGHVWVMGDHRGDSEDSRYHPNAPGGGSIPENEVVGRAFLVIWPPSRLQSLPIPQTFKQSALNAAHTAADGAAPAVPLVTGTAGALPLAWLRLGRRHARKRHGGGELRRLRHGWRPW